MLKNAYVIIFLACFFGLYLPSEARANSDNENRASVNLDYQTIPEMQFREIFHKYLCRRLNKQGSDIVINELKVMGNMAVPAGKVSFQVFQKTRKKLDGHVKVIAMVSVNGMLKNKVSLSAWVDVFESVVRTSRNLKRREVIKKGDVYLERINVSHLSKNVLTDIDRVIGLMVKHNVKEDTILKKWRLEKPPIVERGDKVIIVAESGTLKISAPGRVLEKGYLGELVKVQNSMSKKKLYAKVVNSQTVMVDF